MKKIDLFKKVITNNTPYNNNNQYIQNKDTITENDKLDFASYKIKFLIKEKLQNKDKTITSISAYNKDSEWNESISNEFSELFSSNTDIVDSVFGALGFRIKSSFSYAKFWKNTDPMDFSLNVQFRSYKNAYDDVYLPIRKLQQCFAPSEINVGKTLKDLVTDVTKGMDTKVIEKLLKGAIDAVSSNFTILVPPGRSVVTGGILDFLKSADKNTILQINVGNFIKIRNILPKSITVNWDFGNFEYNLAHDKALPLVANVKIDLQSTNIWTHQTIQELINNFQTEEFKDINLSDIWNMVKQTITSLVPNDEEENKETGKTDPKEPAKPIPFEGDAAIQNLTGENGG